MNVTLETDAREGAVVVRVAGEIDLANAAELRERLLAEAPEEGAECLVADLAGVTYIDSAGIEMLFRLRAGLAARGMELAVVAPDGSRAARLLGLVALGEVGVVCASVDAALESCAGRATG